MDPRLLRYYNQELRYLRELGGEFAREFPKIAARLGMDGLEVADPYVERLLEGSAFLAARVQLKQDAEFPRFSQRLLEIVYPNFLAPTPAMMVAQLHPVPDPNLLKAPTVPRDSQVLGPASGKSRTRCEFRTAQAVRLTPLSVAKAEYFLNVADLGLAGLQLPVRPRAGLRLRLQVPAGMAMAQLDLDALCIYLGGQTDVAMRLHALLLGSTVAVLAGPPGQPQSRRVLPADAVQPVGYADDEALLPPTLRGFAGMRVLQEYFAFPERFLFVRIAGLRAALQACPANELEIVLLLSAPGQGLDGVVDADNFLLHCTPAINLFPKRADRIQIDEGHHEFQVVPDRSTPLDYEVYEVLGLNGYDDHGDERHFLPLYAPSHATLPGQPAYYTSWREPRLVSEQARRDGPRSGYIGSEVFVSLVDTSEAPYPGALRQLSVHTRCTNRDLPIFLGTGGLSEFTLDAGIPLGSVRAVAGPSRPHTSLREGGVAWRFINLLSQNYLSIIESGDGEAVAALRSLLSRFPQGDEATVRRQIEALQGVATRPVVRRHPAPGPIAFARGIEIELTVDELGYQGGSAHLFGAAMHHYLSRHVSMNSFVETSLRSLTRGEIMRWRPSHGQRAVL